MPTYRAYLNKRKGNDHSRIFDVEADDPEAALTAANAEAKKTETVEQVVVLHAGTPNEITADMADILSDPDQLAAFREWQRSQ